MQIQHAAPNARALPPDLISLTRFVLSPIATMAMVIKYLEIVLNMSKK